jgi:Flp pilus assembly pilin Flp
MNKITTLAYAAKNFASHQKGAQIVVFGLIIAVASITLVVALANVEGGVGPLWTAIAHVANCLLNPAVGACK